MIETSIIELELKKGGTELMTLALLEERSRHGYEIRKLIEERSGGVIRLHIATLYPLLYRLETRGWIEGRWVEKAGERRRRFYKITPEGRKALSAQRSAWERFIGAISLVAGFKNA
jgi:transcriptional regulator